MIILNPHLSEKSYATSQKSNTYVFEVPIKANNLQIRQAVAEQFKVSVVSVNTMIRKGKVKKSVRKRVQPLPGKERDNKFAYVTLKSGDKITVFEES